MFLFFLSRKSIKFCDYISIIVRWIESRLRIDIRYLLLMRLLIGSLVQWCTRNWIWRMLIIRYASNQKMNGRLRSARDIIFFKYIIMLFGLTNAPAIFQTYINKILKGLLNIICVVYMDDICIYSSKFEEYADHVR
jgi:hypothetical protein